MTLLAVLWYAWYGVAWIVLHGWLVVGTLTALYVGAWLVRRA